MDRELNTAENVEELKVLLVQRGLKVLPLNYTTQAPIAKLRSTRISSFLASLVVSTLYWGLTLIIIGVPAATIMLALLTILLFERILWLSGMLAKVLKITKSASILEYFTKLGVGPALRLLLFFGGVIFTIFVNAVAVWVGWRLISSYTAENILQSLYRYIDSTSERIPFHSIVFYLVVLSAVLGIFGIVTLVTALWVKINMVEAALAVLVVSGFALLGASLVLVPLGLLLVVGLILFNAGQPLGAVFIAFSLQVILAPFSFVITILASAVMVHASLVKVSANVLGVALLAALIPFLTADAWQLIAAISWTNLAIVAFLVYLWPISVLMYTQRDAIKDVLRDGLSRSNNAVELETLLNTYRCVRDPIDPNTEQIIRSSYHNLKNIDEVRDVSRWNTSIKVKNIVRLLLLILTLPLLVAAFCAFFFHFMLDQQVLFEWTKGYMPSESTAFLPFSTSGLTMLTIKAAVLFGLVSSSLTLGTQFSSRGHVRQFMKEAFIDDMIVDRHLLILNEIKERGRDEGDQPQDEGASTVEGAEQPTIDSYNARGSGARRSEVRDSTKAARGRRPYFSEGPAVALPKISEEAKQLLEAHVKERPAATLAERREFLEQLGGVRVSESTISRTLRGLGYSRTRDGWVRAEEVR